MIRRLSALGALVVALVVLLAAPASAHATLVSSTPANGGIYAKAPKAVTLRFDEAVEVSLGGVRVYDGRENRVVTGSPRHPNGTQSRVTVSLPDLGDGTYVVTWRVVSADSHPVGGAYTFQVGTKATLSNEQALGFAASLLAANGGSQSVGVVYGIDRALLFAGLAVFLGGVAFLVLVWPTGRDQRRARRIVWFGWGTVVVTTLFGIALEGIYAAAFPLQDVFDPTVVRDTLDTRYGHVSLVRLGLLVLAIPLLRRLFRRPAAEHPLGVGWKLGALLVGTGVALTPGLAGHAGTGIQTGLAIPADLVHVAAMACWIGGLVVLCGAVLPRRDVDELQDVLPRFSTVALVAVISLVVTGAYQAWRQVGSLDALKSTDYGKLLIAKLVVFALLVVAAAFSREVVNRRFRTFPEDDELAAGADDVLVGAGRVATVDAGPASPAADSTAGAGGGDDDWDGDDEWADDDRDGDDRDEPTDEEELSRLRRSLWVEVVLAALVLAVTALLVNAAPARSASTEPISLTLKSKQVWVYVDVVPGSSGPDDLHFTSFPTGGGPATVTGMTVQLTRPGNDLPPFDVPLQKLGPGHYWSQQYTIPYSGTWQMTVRVQLGATDEAVLLGRFDLR